MTVVVVGDVELDRHPRTVPVEHVVDARVGGDDERYLHHHEAELGAQPFFDTGLDLVDRLLGLARPDERLVIVRENSGDLLVRPDSGSGQIGPLAGFDVSQVRHVVIVALPEIPGRGDRQYSK